MRRLFLAVLGLLALSSCSSPRNVEPAIRELYRTASSRHKRNPVVVIHGILGARLEERASGRTVWGAFTREASDPASPEGARALALPFGDSELAAMPDLNMSLVLASGPLNALQVGVVFAVVNVGVYAGILKSLGVGGFRDAVGVDPSTPEYAEDHFTCHTFFYDWRRDNVNNAIAFGEYLQEARERVERNARRRIEKLRRAGDPIGLGEAADLEQWLDEGFRFDVVAHSMGGLIARYYLRYGANGLPADGAVPPVTWEGAKDIDRLICVGTPSFGSMDALQNLVKGFAPGGILLPKFDAAILGTMTSIYQLLPRGNELVIGPKGAPMDLDLYDVDVWDENQWGLLDPASDQYLQWFLPDVADVDARRKRAREVVANNLERTRRFHRALDQDAPPCPAEIRLFAADTIPTLERVRMRQDEAGRWKPEFDDEDLYAFGDGTVTRRCALADRRDPDEHEMWMDSPVPWSSVTFLPDDHIGLTSNPIFTDNLLFYLLEQRPPRR